MCRPMCLMTWRQYDRLFDTCLFDRDSDRHFIIQGGDEMSNLILLLSMFGYYVLLVIYIERKIKKITENQEFLSRQIADVFDKLWEDKE